MHSRTLPQKIRSRASKFWKNRTANVRTKHMQRMANALDGGSDYYSLEFNSAQRCIWPDILPIQDRLIGLARNTLSNDWAVRLFSNESIITAPVLLSQEHMLEFSVWIPAGEKANAKIVVAHIGNATKCAAYHLSTSGRDQFQTFTISLEHLAGEKAAFSIGLQTSQKNFKMGITRLIVCREAQLSRINALSNYEWRLKNEVANFSGNAYTHSTYQDKGSEKSAESALAIEKSRLQMQQQAIKAFADEQEQKLRAKIAAMSPLPGESAFGFALRCLSNAIPLQVPNFFARASQLSLQRNTPLRIFSLCSGAARVEEEILKHCHGKAELTLFDASEDLLQRAAARFSEAGHKVRCILGDINKGMPSDTSFDVIMCVSALHHVADLESVLFQINKLLSESGEFWSIGEQVGRNGNRLWPDALEAANHAFEQLPARYRKNAHTGRIDETVPDDDFSLGCFEGIRSEELESMLDSYLIPVEIYKRNCFLWRITDITYCDNFDLSSREDVGHLRELVVAEALHWVCGGKGTELHAIYRKKQF